LLFISGNITSSSSSSGTKRAAVHEIPRTAVQINFAGATINAPIYMDLNALTRQGQQAAPEGVEDGKGNNWAN